MIKKIVLIVLILFFNFFSVSVFSYNNDAEANSMINDDYGSNANNGGGITKQNDGTKCFDGDCTETESSTSIEKCSGQDCLSSTDFKIDTATISPGGNITKGQSTFQAKANFVLGNIIQKMLIGIGTLALLIMSIGAGYMIFYHGHDEYLSKGKTIFTSGITALIVALTSYYLVSLVRYILYN